MMTRFNTKQVLALLFSCAATALFEIEVRAAEGPRVNAQSITNQNGRAKATDASPTQSSASSARQPQLNPDAPAQSRSTASGLDGSVITALGGIIVGIIGALAAFVTALLSAKKTHQKDLALAELKRESDVEMADLQKQRELEVERLKGEKEVANTKLTAELARRSDLEIAHQKFIQELKTDYDKDLRARRIEQYQKLLSLMVNFPKYPEPRALTATELKTLSESFRDWYFVGGGGLFLSEDPRNFSNSSRERYFDLQEGCKIVFQKIERKWAFASGDPPDLAKLRDYLHRHEKWEPPESIKKLATWSVAEKVDQLPAEVVECLRSLASALRTSMTKDILTREPSRLSDDPKENSM